MLQFIAEENDRYSVAELVQMATEGGCGWVQLHLPGLPDEQIRTIAEEVVPLCKESGTILTIEDHVELARQLGIHGVQLTAAPNSAAGSDAMSPGLVRELLGPEAIIGITAASASALPAMKGLDIDYATFTPRNIATLTDNIAAARAAGVEIPLVASGDITIDNIKEYLSTGCNGVAISKAIADADDPVEATRTFIAILQGK